jgi:maltose O-acetyltransferase
MIINDRVRRVLSHYLFQLPRILKYRLLSDCPNISGQPRASQPIQLCGKGRVDFSEGVTFGVRQSPGFYVGYAYIEARQA